ncbi:MAG TPA: hypothetical protein VIT44_01215, partial [Cyclobacteriaceae bacterium]
MKKSIIGFIALTAFSFSAKAQTEINPKIKPDKDKQFVAAEIDKKSNSYKQVAKDIWGYAELGYLENKSSAKLQEILKSEGFKVETGVSGMPTA